MLNMKCWVAFVVVLTSLPAIAECSSNADCKGTRVCHHDQCVDSPAPCAKDTDCPGDLVCRESQCAEPSAPARRPANATSTSGEHANDGAKKSKSRTKVPVSEEGQSGLIADAYLTADGSLATGLTLGALLVGSVGVGYVSEDGDGFGGVLGGMFSPFSGAATAQLGAAYYQQGFLAHSTRLSISAAFGGAGFAGIVFAADGKFMESPVGLGLHAALVVLPVSTSAGSSIFATFILGIGGAWDHLPQSGSTSVSPKGEAE